MIYKGGRMARFVSLTIAAAAVVLGVHSGSIMLALAALCGAGGVASFADDIGGHQIARAGSRRNGTVY